VGTGRHSRPVHDRWRREAVRERGPRRTRQLQESLLSDVLLRRSWPRLKLPNGAESCGKTASPNWPPR